MRKRKRLTSLFLLLNDPIWPATATHQRNTKRSREKRKEKQVGHAHISLEILKRTKKNRQHLNSALMDTRRPNTSRTTHIRPAATLKTTIRRQSTSQVDQTCIHTAHNLLQSLLFPSSSSTTGNSLVECRLLLYESCILVLLCQSITKRYRSHNLLSLMMAERLLRRNWICHHHHLYI